MKTIIAIAIPLLVGGWMTFTVGMSNDLTSITKLGIVVMSLSVPAFLFSEKKRRMQKNRLTPKPLSTYRVDKEVDR